MIGWQAATAAAEGAAGFEEAEELTRLPLE